MLLTLCRRALPGLILAALVPAFVLAADGDRNPPKANYRLANKYSVANISARAYGITTQQNNVYGVSPGWIGKTDEFWYAYRSPKGTNYWRVDPVKKTKTPLFDRAKLAEQLAEVSRKPVDVETMALTRGRVNETGSTFSFVFAEMMYEYDMKNDKLVSKGKAPALPQGPGGFGRRRADDAFDDESEDEPQQQIEKDKEKIEDKTKEGAKTAPVRTTRISSPDGNTILMTRDNDLYVAEKGKEKDAIRLTKGGTEDYGFTLFAGGGFGKGGVGKGKGQARADDVPAPPRTSTWSKDSKHYFAMRRDVRNIKELFVINSLTNPRPVLEKYKYSMPGEDAISKGELHVGTAGGKSILHVAPKWRDESYSYVHWGKEPGELRFLRVDRLRRNIEFCSLDVPSGKGRVLIAEGFDNAPVENGPTDNQQNPIYLEDSNEILWWTERSGWGHYVLHDRQGKKKNNVTAGAWRAGSIVSLDQKNRLLYFRGSAREKGENVYYQHLYRVKLDGTGLTLLDPGDAHHVTYLSPTRKFAVDNSNRIDKTPVTILRDDKGGKVMDLETADLSRLNEYGWKPPETFVVKAADGITDLYGNMWKPFDFDAKKKYPIIAHVYPGPQTEGVTHTFSAYSSNMQLAQLGFIVIQVGHRGGSPLRSKAYGSYGYFNLRDYGLEDKKHAIEQLAAKYAWIDVKKVGIYGHSGGGFMSAAALLQKPYNEFFKAAVASAGNHDNNIYNNFWSEKYHGLKEVLVDDKAKDKTKAPETWLQPAAPPVRVKKDEKKETKVELPKTKFEIKVPTNAELAANLKGRILLVHGELDNNVHPANTMRLADALIKANKRFDMLIFPATRHGFLGVYGSYFQKKMEEFFAEHLLGDRRSGVDFDDRNE